MRIVHMTSAHFWHDVRIFGKMCRSLSSAGWEVHLVAPRQDVSTVEIREGVAVHPVLPARGRVERMLKVVSLVQRRAHAIEADIYHFHDPEFLRTAIGFQRTVQRPVVYDAHEDVRRQSIHKEWIPRNTRRLVGRLAGWVEDRQAARVAAVVAATPSIAARFPSHPRCTVVQNFPVLDEFIGGEEKGPPIQGRFAYVGGLEAVRGIREMVRALPLAGAQTTLALAGRFSSADFARNCRRLPGWDRVLETGYLNRREVRALLGESQAGLVVLHPLENYQVAYPVKMFEYMASGLPVIASDFPLWRSILDEAACGLLVDPLDPKSIAAAMRWIMEHPSEARAMGERGRQAVLRKYNWESEFARLAALYRRLSPAPGAPRRAA